jgi:hypothetical protein
VWLAVLDKPLETVCPKRLSLLNRTMRGTTSAPLCLSNTFGLEICAPPLACGFGAGVVGIDWGDQK